MNACVSNLHYREGQYREACDLVLKYHYSKRVPASVLHTGTLHEPGGLFGNFGPAIAAVFFSNPSARWSENVWELSRLVRREDRRVHLTSLISQGVKSCAKKGCDIIISFADSTAGHHGGIYQACSWNYSGKRSPAMDGLIINGEFVPGRTCNAKFGTRSPERLKAQKPYFDIQAHYDEGKHLYWKCLTKKGKAIAENLGLEKLIYPKPDLHD